MSPSPARLAKAAAPAWAKRGVRPAIRGYGRLTATRRPLPDFLIVGTKRGGTTTLLKNLLQHPNVLPMWPEVENAKKTWFFDQRYHRGEQWYRAHFPTATARDRIAQRTGAPTVTGESAPYYVFHPLVRERVAATLPDVRILMLVRNPVDRIWSHFHERVHNGTEDLSFAEAIAAEPARLRGEAERIAADPRYYSRRHDFCSYLARGRYLEHLGPWLDTFGDRVQVIRSEDLYRRPVETLAQTHRFLGVPAIAPPEAKHFNRIKRSGMPERDRHAMADYYAPHVAALEERLGRRFEWDLRAGGLLGD